MITALLLALAAAAAAAPAAQQVPAGVHVTTGYLTTPEGAPLYTYAHDTMVGMSHCSGDCAKDFPPLIAQPGAKPIGGWTLVGREDGSYQWAYHDKPLYLSAKSQSSVGPFWARASADGAMNPPPRASGLPAPASYALARAESSQFTCDDDRKILAQFVSRDSTSEAIVDAGNGAHTLVLQPWTGGDPQVSWSDGQRTLVWTTGVKLMWMDGPAHLSCGRAMAAHHH